MAIAYMPFPCKIAADPLVDDFLFLAEPNLVLTPIFETLSGLSRTHIELER